MDLLQILFIAIIFVTMGGWVCDWVFSGMVDPILIDKPKDQAKYDEMKPIAVPKYEEKVEFAEYTCPTCGTTAKYSIDVVQTFRRARCQNCGKYFSV